MTQDNLLLVRDDRYGLGPVCRMRCIAFFFELEERAFSLSELKVVLILVDIILGARY